MQDFPSRCARPTASTNEEKDSRMWGCGYELHIIIQSHLIPLSSGPCTRTKRNDQRTNHRKMRERSSSERRRGRFIPTFSQQGPYIPCLSAVNVAQDKQQFNRMSTITIAGIYHHFWFFLLPIVFATTTVKTGMVLAVGTAGCGYCASTFDSDSDREKCNGLTRMQDCNTSFWCKWYKEKDDGSSCDVCDNCYCDESSGSSSSCGYCASTFDSDSDREKCNGLARMRDCNTSFWCKWYKEFEDGSSCGVCDRCCSRSSSAVSPNEEVMILLLIGCFLAIVGLTKVLHGTGCLFFRNARTRASRAGTHHPLHHDVLQDDIPIATAYMDEGGDDVNKNIGMSETSMEDTADNHQHPKEWTLS